MSYTIIGDAVNTASRLVQGARPGEILVTGPVYESIRNMVPARAVAYQGDVSLRGKSGATGDAPTHPIIVLLYFDRLEDFQAAVQQHGKEVMGDIPNFTDAQPVLQINESVV